MGSPPDGDMNATLGKALDRFEVQACRASMRHGIVSASPPFNLGLFFAQHATLECHGGLVLSSLAEP